MNRLHSSNPAGDRYRELFDAIDEGFCVIDVLFGTNSRPVDFQFVDVNLAFEKQTGLRDAVGRRMREFAPTHEEIWFEVYGRVARTGEAMRFESQAEQLGRWYDVYAFPIDHGHRNRVGVLFRDVTERRRAEDLIRESEARQAFLLELSDAVRPLADPLAVQGTASRLLATRLLADRAYYCEVDEPAGVIRIDRDFVRSGVTSLVGRYPIEVFGWVGPAFRGGQSVVVDDVATTSLLSDADRPALAALPVGAFVAVPLVKGGQLVALLCATSVGPRAWTASEVELVTETAERTWAAVERARVESRLREHEHLLQEAAEMAHVGGWSFDPRTGEAEWTDETFRIHNLDPSTAAEVVEQGLARFPGDDQRRIREAVQAAIDHGTPYDLELSFNASGGVRKRVRAICRPVIEGGKVIRIRGSFQDVTERHQLEQQLRQSQKMEAFGQLASGVAHDFNNMLQVINGYAELMLGLLSPGDEKLGLVGEIRNAGERSATLTRQLLAFARKEVVAPRVLEVGATAADTIGMLRRLIGEDVRLVTDMPAGGWPVFIDPGQLEQVVLNLAVNARDAMPGGGTLTVSTRNETVTSNDAVAHADACTGPHAVLSVSDTGCGMPAEVIARIFEPFYTTKGAGKGTGLGLATVYGIVRSASGHVRVRSKVGEGTTFEVYLPRTDQTADASNKVNALVLPRGTETVLVIEDEAAVRSLVTMVLSGYGYMVLEAPDGPSAEKMAAEYSGTIHLVLTDVVMPEAGGRQAAAGVTAKHPEARVLYMSGYTDDAILRQGISAAEMPFLQKPFTPVELIAKVRQVLDAP